MSIKSSSSYMRISLPIPILLGLMALGACSGSEASPEACVSAETIAGFKSALISEANAQSVEGWESIAANTDKLSIEDVTFTSSNDSGLLQCEGAVTISLPVFDQASLTTNQKILTAAGFEIPANIVDGKSKISASFERRNKLDKNGYVYGITNLNPKLLGGLMLTSVQNDKPIKSDPKLKPFGKSAKTEDVIEELLFTPTQLPEGHREFGGIETGAYCNFVVNNKLVYTTDYGEGVFGLNGSMFSADYDWFGDPLKQPKKWDDFNIRVVVTGGTDLGNYFVNFRSTGESIQSDVEEGSTPYKMTIYQQEDPKSSKSLVGEASGNMLCGA